MLIKSNSIISLFLFALMAETYAKADLFATSMTINDYHIGSISSNISGYGYSDQGNGADSLTSPIDQTHVDSSSLISTQLSSSTILINTAATSNVLSGPNLFGSANGVASMDVRFQVDFAANYTLSGLFEVTENSQANGYTNYDTYISISLDAGNSVIFSQDYGYVQSEGMYGSSDSMFPIPIALDPNINYSLSVLSYSSSQGQSGYGATGTALANVSLSVVPELPSVIMLGVGSIVISTFGALSRQGTRGCGSSPSGGVRSCTSTTSSGGEASPR